MNFSDVAAMGCCCAFADMDYCWVLLSWIVVVMLLPCKVGFAVSANDCCCAVADIDSCCAFADIYCCYAVAAMD